MTSIIFIFFLALLASFFLTPFVGKVAKRFDIVDQPSDRKVHTAPIPRVGGVALFLAFFTSLLLFSLNKYMLRDLIEREQRVSVFIIGAVLIFGLGLWDDLRRLPSSAKFAGQIGVATLLYFGGFQIHAVSLPFAGAVQLGIFSLPITIFWFILVINAINLIDGLDGLAAGVTLFVSITMMVTCLANKRLLEALCFASLSGTLLGFLRYNFNPASIFMGDCGSYFLGYLLASLSLLGSIKGQFATAMLIPVIALGVPLIDTLWAPLRRFALGRKMFQPDSGHLHHQLLRLGYSQRRAVLILYAFTIVLGLVSIVMVHAKDEAAALILLVVGSGVIFTGRFIGLRVFFGSGRVGHWLHEVSDVTGMTHERRSFFNHQLAISSAATLDDLWAALCRAVADLDMDLADLVLYAQPPSNQCTEGGAGSGEPRLSSVTYTWKKRDQPSVSWLNDRGLMKIEQPLLIQEGTNVRYFGLLILVKDMHGQAASHFMLTRIEHLRRALITALEQIYA
ncbi:MAG TPA: undecaprenyl/decaprenyl-phosphate alpha-N-acetylglucosaminyl 1-phosphate transferase [Desulfobulbaceae bacterium]|nr:undecaprenyl/decaprenyl-phosphate alpha-N-acetylglucosaminyl 1-phosphate transferase [Desulfobulbaceae bacterium]